MRGLLLSSLALAACATGVMVATPLRAQTRAGAHPYADASVGVGVDRLVCGRQCILSAPAASGTLAAGIASGAALRVGVEYTRYEIPQVAEYSGGRAQAALVTVGVAPAANRLPEFELRLATGVLHVVRTSSARGDVTLDPHAPVFRVGIGYSVGSSHLRFIPTLDFLRTYRHGAVAYYAGQIALGLRWQQ